MAITKQGHYEIYVSVFDEVKNVNIQFYPTENALLTKLNDAKQIVLLKRFTKGLYGVYQQNEQVVISDLRMGVEGNYVFSFVVAEQKDQQLIPGQYQKLSNRLPLDKLKLVFARITDPNIDL
ncbi:hypothetical protein [Pseudoalteromonas sp. B62]|uniref:hypothetical protein n=1 Tax=Pseudoalteromonas sp. B62 TaxID=630483 RepID=UPI00301B99B5